MLLPFHFCYPRYVWYFQGKLWWWPLHLKSLSCTRFVLNIPKSSKCRSSSSRRYVAIIMIIIPFNWKWHYIWFIFEYVKLQIKKLVCFYFGTYLYILTRKIWIKLININSFIDISHFTSFYNHLEEMENWFSFNMLNISWYEQKLT